MNSSLGVVESRQEERRKLREMSNRDDVFDVFVRMVIAYAPLVYVFINLTLLIWVAQTIFNSSLSAVPNSIYLITPLLSMGPIVNIITVQPNQLCPKNTTVIDLQSIPNILSPQISHQQLTVWGDPGIQFCVERLPITQKIHKNCAVNMTLCSGYCVFNSSQCPITKIRARAVGSPPLANYTKFLTMNGNNYFYSRIEGVPIVSFLATYQSRCANDEYYNAVFNTESAYWKAVLACGNEGTVNSFYTQFDTMNSNNYLFANGVPMTLTNPQLQAIDLGYVRQFRLSNNTKTGCANSLQKLQSLQPFLKRKPVGPQFTQSLLIIAFILLVSQLIWLITYYCFEGFINEKNVFVILIAIIEAVIIGFIYAQNQELFYLEKISSTLALCLKQSVPAVSSWNFGISSPQSFKMVIFINTIFLGLFITVYLINLYCFKEVRRRDQVMSSQNQGNQNNLITL